MTAHSYGILPAMADVHAALADRSILNREALEALIIAQQREIVSKHKALASQQEQLHSRDDGSSVRLTYVKQSLVVLDPLAPLDLHSFRVRVKRVKQIVHGFWRRNRRNRQ
jgi:hypothetical protein